MTGLHRTATLDTDNATGDAFGRLRVSEPAHAFDYQPGRSQLVFVTFNMGGGADGVTKRVGYSDGAALNIATTADSANNVLASLSYTTNDSWPTALPGNAIGTIPQ